MVYFYPTHSLLIYLEYSRTSKEIQWMILCGFNSGGREWGGDPSCEIRSPGGGGGGGGSGSWRGTLTNQRCFSPLYIWVYAYLLWHVYQACLCKTCLDACSLMCLSACKLSAYMADSPKEAPAIQADHSSWILKLAKINSDEKLFYSRIRGPDRVFYDKRKVGYGTVQP